MKHFINCLAILGVLSAASAVTAATFYCTVTHPDADKSFYGASIFGSPTNMATQYCERWATAHGFDPQQCTLVSCAVP